LLVCAKALAPIINIMLIKGAIPTRKDDKEKSTLMRFNNVNGMKTSIQDVLMVAIL